MYTWVKSLVIVCGAGMLCGAWASAGDPADDLASSKLFQEEMQVYLHAGDYDAALQAAMRIIELKERTVAVGSTELAVPLHNLATIQRTLQQFDASERNFTRSIDITAGAEGQYSPMLVTSLSQLGVLHYQTQRYADSLDMLRRAQHIAHRNDGVYTLKQLSIVDWITQVNLATEQFLAADLQQRFAYRINVSNYGESDQRMIPAMSKLGNWLRDTGQYRQALTIYHKALAVTETSLGDMDLKLVSQLRAISATLYLQGRCCADEPLHRALDIVVHEPSTDAADELAAIMHLADMSLLTSKAGKAKKYYKRAWNMLASEDRINEEAERLFAAPTRLGVSRVSDVVSAYRQAERRRPQSAFVKVIVPAQSNSGGVSFSFKRSERRPRGLIGKPLALCYPQVLDLVKLGSKEDLSEYYMDLDFSVSQEGKVANIALVESNTPSRLSRYVKNILRLTRFRPRLQEGEPVVTDNISLRQTFAVVQNTNSDADYPQNVHKTAIMHGCNLLAAASS